MKKQRNHDTVLVTLADKNYIKQAKQLFSSVYWNAGWKGDYMLLAHEIPEKELRWFRKKGILIKKCKPLSKKGWGSWPPTLLDKFYLFTPEFKKWKNIIYLDADIIVRASLDNLVNYKKISAVSHTETIINNFKNVKMSSEDQLKKMIKRLKQKNFNLNKSFFNAGVIVFNTNLIKKHTHDCLIQLRNLFDSEERILNVYFYKKWKKLPVVYNIHINSSYYFYGIPTGKNNGIVLHFASEIPKHKPWHPENPFYKEWKNNLERAELIDLNNIPEGKKWSRFEIYKYSSYLILKRQIISFFHYINKIFGQMGILLRKKNPELYDRLKRIERKIRK